MKQYAESVVAGNLTHQGHNQHVVVYGQVALLIDGGQLKLVGGNLVVTGLAGNAQLQRLYFEVFHEGGHTRRNGTEVVVFQLLVLGGLVSHQGASGQQQVRTCGVQAFVNQEVLLFPTQVRVNLLHVGVEVVTYVYRSLVYGTQRFQQRCLVVE